MRKNLSKLFINKNIKYLLLIFLFGLALRYLYFPDDISFGYDQARDAYISLKAISGDIKILGPAASVPGIYHGALIYYILGPLYKIFAGNPFAVAFIFRIINALGIFLIFFFLKILFRSEGGALIAAFLYAISFEQTQFSLFLGHPALGIITILIFFIGCTLFVFSKKINGLYISLLGLGLTIQFHFSSVSLFFVLLLILVIFRKFIPKLSVKNIVVSVFIFLITLSTYILAEFRYGFRTIKTIIGIFASSSSGSGLKLLNFIDIHERVVEVNLINTNKLSLLIFSVVLFLAYYYSRVEKRTKEFFFLFILFVASVIPYIYYVSAQPSFYYSLGASVVFIAISSYVISNIFKTTKIIGYLILLAIVFSNIKLISFNNSKGTVAEINAQEGMLLTNALKIIDYTYSKANGNPFSVSGVTIPFNINTTWSYFYEWYGIKKYGYLPIWGGENALGYEGSLKVETAQSKLPPVKFTIIEPPKGLTGKQIDTFLESEDIFWKVIETKRFGEFTVEYRIPK